ncbi:MAG: AmmeMemoRadiSam system protein B [Candidatus Buchananbacteria bacterium]|nr:AmmeMemoRadiSam system protein B [Candidatus Buchananbacteria bacterium]
MLVFSAICPHPPIIIPTIGKENLEQVENTVLAMKELEKELYASQPDVILIISPHGDIIPEAFSINLNSEYVADFEDFGDWQTRLEFFNSPELIAQIRSITENKLPLILISNQKLDHGTAVPLYYLTKHLKNIPIVPINYSFFDYEKHWQFGELLNKVITKTDLRIAVIASGDLSHCLIKGAPAPYSPKGKEFDKELIALIKEQNYKAALKLDKDLIEGAAECGFRSFLILMGIISEYKHETEILSYEAPFGVGYLVANFKLK